MHFWQILLHLFDIAITQTADVSRKLTFIRIPRSELPPAGVSADTWARLQAGRLYLKALLRLALICLTFPIPILVIGLFLNDLGWLVATVGIFWALCTLLLIIVATPLALLIESILGGIKGVGDRYLRVILSFFFVELLFTLFVSVVPIRNNPTAVPIIFLASALLAVLGAMGIKTGAVKKFVGSATTAILALLILSFFFPNSFHALEDVRTKVDQAVESTLRGGDQNVPSVAFMRDKLLKGQAISFTVPLLGETTWVPQKPIEVPNQTTISLSGPPDAAVRFHDGTTVSISRLQQEQRLVQPPFQFSGRTGFAVTVTLQPQPVNDPLPPGLTQSDPSTYKEAPLRMGTKSSNNEQSVRTPSRPSPQIPDEKSVSKADVSSQSNKTSHASEKESNEPMPTSHSSREYVFEKNELRVKVISCRKAGSEIVMLLQFEKLGDELMTIWLPGSGNPRWTYLLDENGERWDLKDESAGLKNDFTTELVPKTKLRSKFTFMAKGNRSGSIFSLVIKFAMRTPSRRDYNTDLLINEIALE